MTRSRVRSWRGASVAAGVVVIACAVVGPVHEAAHHSLTGHMAQHMALVMLAAPLIAAGTPGLMLMTALPTRPRRVAQRFRRFVLRIGRSPWGMPAASSVLAAHIAVMWAWHVPWLYEAAVRSAVVHAAEHVLMTGTAVAAWMVVIGGMRPAPSLGRLLGLFVLALQCAVLGAAMSSTDAVWYPVHGVGAAALVDQRTAGLVMWAAGGVAPILAAGVLIAAWLRDPDANAMAGAAGVRSASMTVSGVPPAGGVTVTGLPSGAHGEHASDTPMR